MASSSKVEWPWSCWSRHIGKLEEGWCCWILNSLTGVYLHVDGGYSANIDEVNRRNEEYWAKQ
jgi:hypothetical protein